MISQSRSRHDAWYMVVWNSSFACSHSSTSRAPVVHLIEKDPESIETVLRHVEGTQSGCRSLQPYTHVIDLAQLRPGEPRDHRSTAGLGTDETPTRKRSDRFAHRAQTQPADPVEILAAAAITADEWWAIVSSVHRSLGPETLRDPTTRPLLKTAAARPLTPSCHAPTALA